MPTKQYLLILILLITLTTSFWTQQQISQHTQYPTSGFCRADTICRTPNLTQYNYDGIIRSGYLKVDLKNSSALGFLFFGKKGAKIQQLKTIPTIIVLGGGPGSSSLFNNFRQVGPLAMKKIFSPTIQDNKYTWALHANLLFIDQPVGTGISCLASANYLASSMSCNYLSISLEITLDFYRAFYQIFNQQANGCFNSKNLNIPSSSPFYLFGQGYGAKFVTAIATKLINQKNNGGSITGLKGIGIGNAFIAPFRIMSQIGNFGFSLGLLDYQQRMRIQKILLKANLNNQKKDWSKLKTDYQKAINYLYQRTGINYYDITKDKFQQGKIFINKLIDLLQPFFANKTNLNQFGFQTSINFQTFSSAVYNKLSTDFMQPQISNLQFILKSNIPVLIYQGQDDAYVNTGGTIRWVEDINYQNSNEFRNKNLEIWKIGDVRFGSIKSSGKLTFIIVNNAGHYVPMDNPQAAYYMFRGWLQSTMA